MANVEYVTDKMPQYVFNKHTTYENTVLQEHASIVSALKDTGTNEALIESQARMFIGLCMKDQSIAHIEEKFPKYYNNEYEKLKNIAKDSERRNIAFTRAWIQLINDAVNFFINKYKVDGSKAKIAIVDDLTSDGRRIIEPDDVPVEYSDD